MGGDIRVEDERLWVIRPLVIGRREAGIGIQVAGNEEFRVRHVKGATEVLAGDQYDAGHAGIMGDGSAGARAHAGADADDPLKTKTLERFQNDLRFLLGRSVITLRELEIIKGDQGEPVPVEGRDKGRPLLLPAVGHVGQDDGGRPMPVDLAVKFALVVALERDHPLQDEGRRGSGRAGEGGRPNAAGQHEQDYHDGEQANLHGSSPWGS